MIARCARNKLHCIHRNTIKDNYMCTKCYLCNSFMTGHFLLNITTHVAIGHLTSKCSEQSLPTQTRAFTTHEWYSLIPAVIDSSTLLIVQAAERRLINNFSRWHTTSVNSMNSVFEISPQSNYNLINSSPAR